MTPISGGGNLNIERIGRQNLLSEKIHFLLVGLLLPSAQVSRGSRIDTVSWWISHLPCSFHTAWRMSQCFEDILPMKSQSHSPWLPWLVKRAEGWTFSFISLISSLRGTGGLSSGYLLCETLGHGGSWSQELNLAHRSNSFYPQARQGVTFPVHALSATPSRIWSAADCRGWYHCSRPVRLGLSTPSKIAGYPINLVLNGQFDGTNIWICWMSVESLCSPHHSTW